MTQLDLKTNEISIYEVAVSYTPCESNGLNMVKIHAVSLDETKLPVIEGSKIVTGLPLYLVVSSLYALEIMDKDGDDLLVVFKRCKNGEAVFHSVHADLRSDATYGEYTYEPVPYIRSVTPRKVFYVSDPSHWLRTALGNQIDNVTHGSSQKFPCQTLEEKRTSLRCIQGMLKLLDECDQNA